LDLNIKGVSTKNDTIVQGDTLEVLKALPDNFVDLIVTSPPYWKQRDYEVEGQLGLEPDFREYLAKLTAIFQECGRVLKPQGSLWINIKDSYAKKDAVLNEKTLCGIPERLVISLTDSGWIRRSTIIWHKPDITPQSAKTRFTDDFEYFYFFTKNDQYHFVTQYEPFGEESLKDLQRRKNRQHLAVKYTDSGITHYDSICQKSRDAMYPEQGRLKRSVWKISMSRYRGTHSATFPETLVETPIKACCPPGGLVLDPFMGAGTTAVVAKRNGCHYLGIELNPQYIQDALARLTQEFGENDIRP
jgi:DNA modification methylase